jgi:hypothetical protein
MAENLSISTHFHDTIRAVKKIKMFHDDILSEGNAYNDRNKS